MAGVAARRLMYWMFNLKLRTFMFLFGSMLVLYFIVIILQQISEEFHGSSEIKFPVKWNGNFEDVRVPVVVWWTPFTGSAGETRHCGDVACFFTDDRRFTNHSQTKMLAFYGTLFDPTDLPLPRDSARRDWALLHEESPKNTPVLMHPEVLALFNFSATFSRWSSFPLTLQYLPSLDALTGSEYLVPTSEKMTHAPVVYVHSDCGTPLDRDAYAAELMKHIAVDSLGKCLQNKPLPPQLADMTDMDRPEFLRLTARYLFALSFENARCDDYVTEKLWRPLIVGSVPVYLGAATVRDWLPNNDSAILASDFESPAALARHLWELAADTQRYERHLRHKLAPPARRVANRRLEEAMGRRRWGVGDDDGGGGGNFVEHFECFLCAKMHDRAAEVGSVVSPDHYKCERPVSSLTGKPDPANWWLDQWDSSACEAKVLRSFVDAGKPVETHEQMQSEVHRFIDSGLC